MSRKPSEKPDSTAPEDSLSAVEFPNPVDGGPRHPAVPDGDEQALNDDEEYDEEEFSLDKLSQAYADVLRSQSGQTIAANHDPDDADDTQADLQEPIVETQAPLPEIDDNACCPISPESIIESILFVGTPKDVKLNSRKVAAVLRDVSPKEVTKIVRQLNAKYENENAAYRIKSDGGVFKMVLDPNLIEFQQEFFGRNRQVRLSQAAIDVMAIVAYNQPVTRDQVDKIRAKPSGSVLGQLVRRNLINIEPGKTDPKVKYYATTDRFLDLFQLDELADLPQSHDVSDMEELVD